MSEEEEINFKPQHRYKIAAKTSKVANTQYAHSTSNIFNLLTNLKDDDSVNDKSGGCETDKGEYTSDSSSSSSSKSKRKHRKKRPETHDIYKAKELYNVIEMKMPKNSCVEKIVLSLQEKCKNEQSQSKSIDQFLAHGYDLLVDKKFASHLESEEYKDKSLLDISHLYLMSSLKEVAFSEKQVFYPGITDLNKVHRRISKHKNLILSAMNGKIVKRGKSDANFSKAISDKYFHNHSPIS